jgi:hypothetical protein
MDTLREKHSSTGSDNGGRFAAHQHDEAETTLATVTVKVAHGSRPRTLTRGVLDHQTQDTLSSGQCVAFAVAVAEQLHVDTIGVLVDTDGGERSLTPGRKTRRSPTR